jgi:M6 family metalloprotease-like protein
MTRLTPVRFAAAALAAGLLLVTGANLVAQQASGGRAAATPDLADFRTVDKAQAADVRAANPAVAGQVGYLGARFAADAAGKLAVADVPADSPAGQAGLKVGDVVTALDGMPIARLEALRSFIQAKTPGDSLKLTVLRDGKELELTATVAALSKPMKLSSQPQNAARVTLGVMIGDEREGEGAPIEQIFPGSPAERANLKVGDLIVKIDGIVITGPARLREVLAGKNPNDTVTVTVRTDAKVADLKVQLSAAGGGPGGGGRGAFAGGPPTTLWKGDTYRLAVVCIEYPDIKHNAKIAAQDWEAALFSKDQYKKVSATGEPVHGSLNDYFLEQSCAALTITGKVFDWVELSKKRGEYSQGSGTSNKTVPLVEALTKLTARDGNDCLKNFDGIFFIYAGEAIRTNRGSLYFPHCGSLMHQGKRWTYLLTPEGGSQMTRLGGYCREFAFMLGLPDLAARTENAGVEGAGVWCAMSNPFSHARPQHLCAFAKEKIGWLKPTVIDPTVRQKLLLAPIEGSKTECYKVLVRPDGSEYLLLENRTASKAPPARAATSTRCRTPAPITTASRPRRRPLAAPPRAAGCPSGLPRSAASPTAASRFRSATSTSSGAAFRIKNGELRIGGGGLLDRRNDAA